MVRVPQPRRLAAAVLVAIAFAGAPALAQQRPSPAEAAPGAVAATVGHWLYDDRGEVIGSVKSLSPDGRTATIRLGVYLRDYVRVVEVPAGAVSVEDGRAVLRPGALRMAGEPAGGG